MDVVFYTRHTSPEPLTPRVLLARNVSRWFGYGGIIFVMISKKTAPKTPALFAFILHDETTVLWFWTGLKKKNPDLNIQHIQ